MVAGPGPTGLPDAPIAPIAPDAPDAANAPAPSEAAPSASWLLLCALLGGGSLLAWWAPASLLDWQPARATAEPWRLVTAAWVHWSEWHLGANLAATGVVALLGRVARLPRHAALALLLAWPLTHAGLWIQPALAHYGGASGVLHAAVAVAACWLVAGAAAPAPGARSRARARWIGGAIAAGLVLKVLLEAPWAGPLASARAWDIAVAPAAHASGALAGFVAALLALALRPRTPELH